MKSENFPVFLSHFCNPWQLSFLYPPFIALSAIFLFHEFYNFSLYTHRSPTPALLLPTSLPVFRSILFQLYWFSISSHSYHIVLELHVYNLLLKKILTSQELPFNRAHLLIYLIISWSKLSSRYRRFQPWFQPEPRYLASIYLYLSITLSFVRV